MAGKYLKIWTDFENILSPLEEDEIGRLFLYMLHYAKTGEEPDEIMGNERFLWPVAKRDIDMAMDKVEILKANGSRGGRPKSKENQTEQEETKENQTEANESRKEKKRKEIERNENFIDDDDAARVREEQNQVLNAAEDAGFERSNMVRAKLIDLYAEHGIEKMLRAIDECVVHGATTIAYLRAVLQGSPKKKAASPAQNYQQRNPSGMNAAAMEEMRQAVREARDSGMLAGG